MVKFETAVATAVLGMQDNLSMSGCITLTAADSVDQCRTVLARALLAMQDSISMDVLFYQQHPDRGWQFKPEVPGCTADIITGADKIMPPVSLSKRCLACCRTVLARALLGMQDSISLDVLFYQRHPDRGWQFKPEVQGCTADTANGGLQFIRELYEKHNSEEKSVPILFDKKTMTIVNNESADIVRMFATECQVRLSNHTLCC